MKLLFCSTSTNNTTTVISSLAALNIGEVSVYHYDGKWNSTVQQILNTTPALKEQLQAGQWPPPDQREGMRLRCAPDDEMLALVEQQKPDVVFYISAWEGVFVPNNETLHKIGLISPLVHICFDASDSPWHSQMLQFEKEGIFKLTVNIDGGHNWPGGKYWPKDEGWKINGLTLLTPLDTRFFEGPKVPFSQRSYAVAYAGNAGGFLRSTIASKLHQKGYAIKLRDDRPGDASYAGYCQFLRQCKVSINVPFTGSTEFCHVKGRVLESGYAGAALLEWKNSATREWFIPRYEYFEYESVEECIEMAEWLEKHPRICEEMARALHHKVTTEHSPQIFWAKVLTAAKVAPSLPAAAE